jgi:hypothetical protein
MKKILLLLFPILSLVGCSSISSNQSEGLRDENLLMQLPIPGDGWINQSSKVGRETTSVWVKPNESLKLKISHGVKRLNLQRTREKMSEFAQQDMVAQLKEQTLQEGSVNNYPMLLWQTETTLKSGDQTVNLFLFIQGNDACYFMQRRWNYPTVPPTELKLWIDYLKSVSVCDTRDPKHPCPILR